MKLFHSELTFGLYEENMSNSNEASSDREKIAREIKQIVRHINDHPEDTETINKAVKLLRSKSESGYRGLVRVLQKFGKIHVLLGGQTAIEDTKPIKDETDTNHVNNTFTGRGLNSSTLPSNSQRQNLPKKRSYAWEKAKTTNAISSTSFPRNDSGTGNPLSRISDAISGSNGIISGSSGSRMTGSDMGNSTGNAQFLQVPQASPSETPRLTPQHEPVQSPQPSSRRSSKDQLKIDRYRRTKELLEDSGLLSVTNRTADLLKQNKLVNNDIESLRQQTEDFVKSVQRNPANQALLNNLNNPTLNSIANVDAASESDNTEFANILSGIYDFELPSVILEPLMPGDPQDQLSLEQTNTMHTPEVSGASDSETTSAHLARKRPKNNR